MDNDRFYCVIMAGGGPLQMRDIAGCGKSLLRATYDRFAKLVPASNILVVTSDTLRDDVMANIPGLPENNLLLEPDKRGTAPCIAYATYSILKRDPQAVVAVTPADHIIFDEEAFVETMTKAFGYASDNDALTMIGIVPDKPETRYGYMQVTGGKKNLTADVPVKVKTFTEKPDAELAKVFYSSGEFLWNSGIGVWKASVIVSEMKALLPEVADFFDGWEDAIGTAGERLFIESAYGGCSKISIDYGVLEKTSHSMLYPAKFLWADAGIILD